MLPRSLGGTSRALVRAPLFSSVSIITLALGIGATTAIFAVVYGVLLKPLPYEDSGRLVGLWHTAPGANIPVAGGKAPGPRRLNQGPATYLTYREEGRVFEDIGLWDEAEVTFTGDREPERLKALLVSDGLLPVLRVRPHVGRVFTREDDSPAAPERVMLGYAYWERAYGARTDAIGRQIVVDGRAREIVGVLPRGQRVLDRDADVLLPFRFNAAQVFIGQFSYQAIGRLKPGATIGEANADVARMIPMVFDRFPIPPGLTRQMFDELRLGPRVRPLADEVIGDVGPVLWVLLATVGIVLLIACANVANLFLIRAEGRQQELAVQCALGAHRRAIARQWLAESLLISLAAGALGVLLTRGGIDLLLALAPDGLPRQNEIAVGPIVLAFALALSLVAGVVFGSIPLLRFSAARALSGLRDGGRGASDSGGRNRARDGLVVFEIALSLVLLVASGLMLQTLQELRRVDPGFIRPAEVFTFRIHVPESLIPDPRAVVRTYEQVGERIRRIPGVRSVGSASSLTMEGLDVNDVVFVENSPTPPGRLPPIRRFKWMSPGYQETMGNDLVAGRRFNWNDVHGAARVALVSESFARECWKTPAAAIGKRIRQGPNQPWREVVGVVGDERDDGMARPSVPTVYWPMLVGDWARHETWAPRGVAFAVRSATTGSPALLREVQRAVWSVNAALPIANVSTLDAIQVGSMAQTSFALVMLTIAAVVSLALGVVGVYGVVAYVVTQRTREIGIRMALGAEPRVVSRLFVRHGLALTASGLALGAGAAAILTRLMAALLFGVSAWDPLTYAVLAAALGIVALAACYVPAWRAARVEPLVALRAR